MLPEDETVPETVTETEPVGVEDGDGEFLDDKLEDTVWVSLVVTDCEPDVLTLPDADTDSDGDEEVVWQ